MNSMFEAVAVPEFPFVQALPKREKSKLEKVWEGLREMSAVVEKEGSIIPQPFAARLLDVSRQRIAELADQGRLRVVEVNGHRFVTEASVVAYAKSERKAGRPVKLDREATEHPVKVLGTVWKASLASAREMQGKQR